MQHKITIMELIEALNKRSCRRIQADTGIHRNTISDIRSGKRTNMHAATLSILTQYVRENGL
jgi:hypothetical protein